MPKPRPTPNGTSQNGPPLTDEDVPVRVRKLAEALPFGAGHGSFGVSEFRVQSLGFGVKNLSFEGLV